MNKMPKISVVMPIYNTEKYLSACLDSLLAQTVKDIEVIAVNNGSTDGCEKILKEYAAKDRRVLAITKPHGNIYTARNAALHAAIGEWIAFCDSDDLLPPNAYAYMLEKAEKSKCDVLVGGFIEVNEKSGMLPATMPRRNVNAFQVLMYTPCVWNKWIRRDFLVEHGLEFPAIPMGEDMVFLAKLLKYDPRIERVNRPVYYYWHHLFDDMPSVTHRYTFRIFQEHIQCHRMVYEEMKDTQYQEDAAAYVYFSLILYLKDFLPKVWEGDERKACFTLFRNHLLTFDWTRHTSRFLQILGVPLSKFRSMSAETYFMQIIDLNHRKAVLEEYRAGVIGFQYIVAYIRAWMKFKIRRFIHKI